MIELSKHQDGNDNLFIVRISGRLSEREYRVDVPQICCEVMAQDTDSLPPVPKNTAPCRTTGG